MYSEPVAYLLTWTCYGTWLHGDERDSTRREWSKVGKPVLQSDPVLLETMRRRLRQPPTILDHAARTKVEQTIDEVCTHRLWYLHATNARSNHVHVVVGNSDGPEKMLGDMKAWCTRRLRESGLFAKGRIVWTDGGSTRYLWTAEDLAAANDYVLNRQGPDSKA